MTAQLFVPLTTIEEVIKQHQNGMTGHEIKRSVKTSISVSSSCPPPPNVVLPHSPPILPSFPNPIYFERGINSAIAQHIRETRPFDNEILNACSMFPGFVRKVSILNSYWDLNRHSNCCHLTFVPCFFLMELTRW